MRPELVAEVKYLIWTDDNLLRQVVYEGLREEPRRPPRFAGRCRTDHPDRLAERLIMSPSRCDNCNGDIHTSRLDTKAERFCSMRCAGEYNPGCITDRLTQEDVGVCGEAFSAGS